MNIPDIPESAEPAEEEALSADAPAPDEADFESAVTFADFDAASFASKYPVRLWLRYESAAPLTVLTAGSILS